MHLPPYGEPSNTYMTAIGRIEAWETANIVRQVCVILDHVAVERHSAIVDTLFDLRTARHYLVKKDGAKAESPRDRVLEAILALFTGDWKADHMTCNCWCADKDKPKRQNIQHCRDAFTMAY